MRTEPGRRREKRCRRSTLNPRFDVLLSSQPLWLRERHFQRTKAKLACVVRALFMDKRSPQTVCELCSGGAGKDAGKQTASVEAAGPDRRPSGRPRSLGSAASLAEASQPEQLRCDHTRSTFGDSGLVKAGLSADWRAAAAGRGGVCHRGCEGEPRQHLDGNKGRNP